MDEKRITAIMMYWYPYVGATQPIYKSIFNRLVEDGYKIDIIAGIPHYRKGRKELWRDYKGVFYKKSIENDMFVQRTFVLSPKFFDIFDRHGIVRRLVNYTSFFVSAFLTAIFSRQAKPKFFFVPTFPPIFAGLLAFCISTLKKRPFVYNVQDVHPDILYSIKLFRARPISFVLEKSEKFVYSRAKHIIAISDTIKNTLYKKGVPLEKISVIPNFCDTDIIKPAQKDIAFSRQYDLIDKFIVMYAGNISQPQGIEFIIEAAKKLRDRKDIQIVFVGRGEQKEGAKNLALQANLKNVSFIPLQPVERMSDVWASADVCLVSLRKNVSHLAFPSKIFGILSSGRPLIAMVDKDSEIWKFIEKSDSGLCVQSEDSDGLADAILKMVRDTTLRNHMGKKGRNFVVKNFSKSLVGSKYKELFDQLCSGL